MSKPEPVLSESVTKALKAYHDEMLIMVHDAVIGVVPPSNKGLLRLYELRRAIAAAILRAEAKVCWNYGRTAAHKELLAQADALEKEPADGA